MNKINSTLGHINSNFVNYQSTITNQPWFQFIVGSAVTFFATWLFDKIKSSQSHRQYLYYQYRMIIEQINMVIETERTIITFLDTKLAKLISNIDNNPENSWSADVAYFPMFSARSLPEKIATESTGSGYLDNKISKIYSMSKDIPHIIEDLRYQFDSTLKINEKMVHGQLNSAQVQKAQFKNNLNEYERAMKDDMLSKNIPIYLKKLAETAVAINQRIKTGPLGWKFRFDPRYKFHISRKTVIADMKNLIEKMDSYFENERDVLVAEIDTGRDPKAFSVKQFIELEKENTIISK